MFPYFEVSAGIIFIACGVYVLIMAGLSYLGFAYDRAFKRTFADLRSWPDAPGQMQSARFTNSLEVAYEFTVAGAAYVGHGVTLGRVHNQAEAQAFIEQHPPGSPVTVVYNPADPRQAYLSRDGSRPFNYQVLGLLGLGLALPGCCALLIIPFVALGSLALPSGGPPAATAQAQGQVASLAFAPNGQVLAGGGCGQFLPGSAECVEGAVYLWDVSNPGAARLLGSLVSGGSSAVNSVAYSPDGAALAGIGQGDAVILLNVSKPARPQPAGAPFDTSGVVVRVAFSPDGKTLAAGDYGNEVQLWDVSNPAAPSALGKPLAELPGPAYSLAFSPDGKMLAVESICASADSNACSSPITLWDVSSPAAPRPLASPFGDHAAIFSAVAFSPDSKVLAAAAGDKALDLWDVSSPSAPRLLGAPLVANGFIYGLAFNANGKILAVGDNTLVTLWDVSDPRAEQRAGTVYPAEFGVDGIAYSPNSPTLALISNGKVYIWDVSDPASPRAVGQPLIPPALATPR